MGQESSTVVDDNVKPTTLSERSLDAVAELIKSGRAKKIVVLTGAGISTSAGIPDFRSPETGLYANLARLNLPYAEAVFDISYFREHPDPFYALARELYPGKFAPTIAHAFISLLAKKGFLRMLFTQNIDCLEREAGVPGDKIIEAHGSFATQRCIECKTEYPDDKMKEAVMSGEVPHCGVPQCNGLVKPDIVFFGEQLPAAFFDNRDVPEEADLMLILGTSLTVQPFASLPSLARDEVPRVLFNLEKVGGLGSRPDDVCVLGDCDGGIRKLSEALGWTEELESLWKSVGGKPGVKPPQPEPKTRDEELEAEIEKLTGEVDHTLKLHTGHMAKVTAALEKKQNAARDASDDAPKDAPKGAPEDTPKDATRDLKSAEVLDKSESKSETDNSREPITPVGQEAAVETAPSSINESSTSTNASDESKSEASAQI
jgi:NAD-dependent histone deacetylase SIR2